MLTIFSPPLWTEKLELFFFFGAKSPASSDTNLSQITLQLWVGTLFSSVKFQFSQCLSSQRKKKKLGCGGFTLFDSFEGQKTTSNTICTYAFMFQRQVPLGLAFVYILIFFLETKIKF